MIKTKYNYYLNNKKVGRSTFYNNLKKHSQRVAHTSRVGCFGVDFCELDARKYKSYCKALNGAGGYAPRCIGFIDDYGNDMFKIEKQKVFTSKSKNGAKRYGK